MNRDKKRTLILGGVVAVTSLVAAARIDTGNEAEQKPAKPPAKHVLVTTTTELGQAGFDATNSALDSAFFYLASQGSGSRFTSVNRTELVDVTPPTKTPEGYPQETVPAEQREYRESIVCETTFTNAPEAESLKAGTEVSITYSHGSYSHSSAPVDEVVIDIANRSTGQTASLNMRGTLPFSGSKEVCNLPSTTEQLQYMASELVRQPETEVSGGVDLVGYQKGYDTVVSTSTVSATENTMPFLADTIHDLIVNPAIATTTVPTTTPERPTDQRPGVTVDQYPDPHND